jgi:glutamyl endopeptidase
MAAAVSLTALTAGLGVHARTAQAADPNLGVVSNGASIKAGEVSRTFVRSFRGQARGVRALDSFADVKALSETPSQLTKLLALQPVPSPKSNPESIIPPFDSRVRVNPTTGFPASATALVTFSAGRCTGWLIGPDTVVTAGHCVHQGGGGAFYPTGSFRVYPGRNGLFSPFGSCTARWVATVVGWAVSGDDQYDYGAIKLNCTIGNTTGWYGFFWTTASLTGLPTIINGYPGDKPLTQWQSKDLVRVTQARRVFYQNDTVGGMSGSAAYYNRPGCGSCSMAVHAYGTYNGPPFSTNNHGTRITQGVFNNLIAWRNAP